MTSDRKKKETTSASLDQIKELVNSKSGIKKN